MAMELLMSLDISERYKKASLVARALSPHLEETSDGIIQQALNVPKQQKDLQSSSNYILLEHLKNDSGLYYFFSDKGLPEGSIVETTKDAYFYYGGSYINIVIGAESICHLAVSPKPSPTVRMILPKHSRLVIGKAIDSGPKFLGTMKYINQVSLENSSSQLQFTLLCDDSASKLADDVIRFNNTPELERWNPAFARPKIYVPTFNFSNELIK